MANNVCANAVKLFFIIYKKMAAKNLNPLSTCVPLLSPTPMYWSMFLHIVQQGTKGYQRPFMLLYLLNNHLHPPALHLPSPTAAKPSPRVDIESAADL
jgi:hypothetical protein